MKATEILNDLEAMIARNGSSLRVAMISVGSAFGGVVLAGTIMLTMVDRKIDFIAKEGARLGTGLYLSNSYEVSGPGGIGRVLVLPNHDDAPIRQIDCPSWVGTDATCLSLDQQDRRP